MPNNKQTVATKESVPPLQQDWWARNYFTVVSAIGAVIASGATYACAQKYPENLWAAPAALSSAQTSIDLVVSAFYFVGALGVTGGTLTTAFIASRPHEFPVKIHAEITAISIGALSAGIAGTVVGVFAALLPEIALAKDALYALASFAVAAGATGWKYLSR